ncbi:MAG: hypothetical protein JRI97_10225 [Deltaproteobacteria bacterium]|nr:hypothetical protein [Deltaproteobacteria bacterium]
MKKPLLTAVLTLAVVLVLAVITLRDQPPAPEPRASAFQEKAGEASLPLASAEKTAEEKYRALVKGGRSRPAPVPVPFVGREMGEGSGREAAGPEEPALTPQEQWEEARLKALAQVEHSHGEFFDRLGIDGEARVEVEAVLAKIHAAQVMEKAGEQAPGGISAERAQQAAREAMGPELYAEVVRWEETLPARMGVRRLAADMYANGRGFTPEQETALIGVLHQARKRLEAEAGPQGEEAGQGGEATAPDPQAREETLRQALASAARGILFPDQVPLFLEVLEENRLVVDPPPAAPLVPAP